MTKKSQMGQTKELVKAYVPMIAALVIIALLNVRAIKGWALNLRLFALVGSEVLLMVRQRHGLSDSDLVEALMKGPPKRTRDEALGLAHLPRIAVEIFASWAMPPQGDLALTVMFVALLISNMTVFLNGGEIVTGDVPPKAVLSVI